eukprot:129311-Pleurochrysis_carterae.AAC.1
MNIPPTFKTSAHATASRILPLKQHRRHLQVCTNLQQLVCSGFSSFCGCTQQTAAVCRQSAAFCMHRPDILLTSAPIRPIQPSLPPPPPLVAAFRRGKHALSAPAPRLACGRRPCLQPSYPCVGLHAPLRGRNVARQCMHSRAEAQAESAPKQRCCEDKRRRAIQREAAIRRAVDCMKMRNAQQVQLHEECWGCCG